MVAACGTPSRATISLKVMASTNSSCTVFSGPRMPRDSNSQNDRNVSSNGSEESGLYSSKFYPLVYNIMIHVT